MREAVYEDLLPGERGDLHVRLAEALDGNPALSADSVGPAAELAWHWHQAHELPHALRASIEAGAQAEKMRAPADAARHLENAVELWDRVERPGAGRRHDARGAAAAGRRADATWPATRTARPPWASASLELIGDSDPVAAALARERLGRYLWTSGRHSESAEEYARAVEQMPAEPPSRRARQRARVARAGAHAARATCVTRASSRSRRSRSRAPSATAPWRRTP